MSRPRRVRLVVEAGRVLAPGGELAPGHLVIEGTRIAAVRRGEARHADLRFAEGTAAPGFIDLQVNGCAGVDFLAVRAREDLAPAAAHLARTGVTAFLATLITAPRQATRRAMRVFATVRDLRPQLLGVHLEGPFLNPRYAGAHDPALLLVPNRDALRRLLAGFEDLVRLVTLAPELPGADGLIDLLRRVGVVVAAGHTDAAFEAAVRAFDRGVTVVTHLFNAMRPFHHREPGIVGAGLGDPRVAAGLILDGVHVHAAAARLALRLLGAERTVLVTDAVAAAGLPPGTYRLGMREIVHDGAAPRLASGTLAGSVLTMDAAVRAAVGLGWSLRDAVRMATETPARVLGVTSKGRLAPAADADLVILDGSLQVAATVCGGEVVYRRPEGEIG